jgi:hypothetical protein
MLLVSGIASTIASVSATDLALLAAVKSGRIAEAQLDQSVLRSWRPKPAADPRRRRSSAWCHPCRF